MSQLLHELVQETALRQPHAEALRLRSDSLGYGALASQIDAVAGGVVQSSVERQERVAIYLDKRFETVVSMFAISQAGAIFVPINPLFKPEQVAYILRDCNVRLLVTSPERLLLLQESLRDCHDLHTLVLVGGTPAEPAVQHVTVRPWNELASTSARATHRTIDSDIAAILYTSGSTGRPKGVILSHRNMVSGADSVARYLENTADDRLLAVLPFSFDYGLSQLTTAFLRGASVSLLNYLMPRDIVLACERDRITGLAAVPPLWIQLASFDWPSTVNENLRYITNSGGAMPTAVVRTLRSKLPRTRVYLMYGLTEAFRSTYLPPEEVDRRPDSIGKAIPNTDILVVRPDGSPSAPGEPGELVHRGALVALGYWNDAKRTAERFRPDPLQHQSVPTTQLAVWSGDTVRMDDEGYLYFIGRQDDMIKTSGYRVSPSEVEEVVYAAGLRGEIAALGVPHPILGQAVVLVRTHRTSGDLDDDEILGACKRHLPAFMVPLRIESRESLPRNPNGKIDRKLLTQELKDLFQEN